jgi:hypothetical protein
LFNVLEHMPMKRLLILLLLLASCDSQRDEASGGRGAATAPAGLEDPLIKAADPAALQRRAETAMTAAVLDPASARYANIREGSGGSICGDVNAKGEDGRLQGFRPFVVSPEGVAVVSSAATIMFDNPADLYPDFYLRYCAPLEELPTLHQKIVARTPDLPAPPDASLGPAPPSDLPPLDDPVGAAPPPPPVPAPKPAPRTPAPTKDQAKAPTGDEDSFFNAVIRNKQ